MNQSSLRVLLVDDEESFVKVLAMHLSDTYGYNTTVAFTGREAIELLEQSHTGFDVMILDYMMPEMDGLIVLQRMLEQKIQIPVIMLTAAGSEYVAVEALKLGAYDYARKELLDIPHLDILIRGTYERHCYHVVESMEKEKQQEIRLNNAATEQVRSVLNAMTPPLTTALAQLALSIDTDSSSLMQRIPEKEREDFQRLVDDIRKNVQTLETSVKGLLSLFQLLYAHHSEVLEIDKIRDWLETTLKDSAN